MQTTFLQSHKNGVGWGAVTFMYMIIHALLTSHNRRVSWSALHARRLGYRYGVGGGVRWGGAVTFMYMLIHC